MRSDVSVVFWAEGGLPYHCNNLQSGHDYGLCNSKVTTPEILKGGRNIRKDLIIFLTQLCRIIPTDLSVELFVVRAITTGSYVLVVFENDWWKAINLSGVERVSKGVSCVRGAKREGGNTGVCYVPYFTCLDSQVMSQNIAGQRWLIIQVGFSTSITCFLERFC